MISSRVLYKVSKASSINIQRSIGTVGPLLNKTSDPIQKLFLDKLQEYRSRSSDGKLVDSNPSIEREMKNELERVAKQFGGGSGVDMAQFPGFKFEDPQIDSISN